MRRGRSTMLLLGGVLALLAFFVLYIGLSAAGGGSAPEPIGTPTPEPKAQVVVAATDIPAFTVLEEEMLTIKEVEISTILSDTTASTVDLVGQMTTRDYVQEAQIKTTDVTDPGISQILEPGERAFVLPIQEINNFGGQLVEGDLIDMLWTREFETTQTVPGVNGEPESRTTTLGSTKTILQNLKVLRMISLKVGGESQSQGNSAVNSDASLESGTSQDQEAAAANAAAMRELYADASTGGAEAMYSAAAVLAISDQQAEVIKYAREYGKISLTLRAKDDTEEEVTTGITDKIMVQDYGLIVPEVIIK